MSLTGDFQALGAISARVEALQEVPSRVSARVAKELEELVEMQFDAGADPDGNAWAPLSDVTLARGRTPPPLTDTGAMRSSLRVTPLRGAGVSVSLSHPAAAHQTGWSGPQGSGPARPILPEGNRLPELWEEVVRNAIDEEWRRTA